MNETEQQFEVGQAVRVVKPASAFHGWQGTVEGIHPFGFGGATVLVRLSLGGMVFLDNELEIVQEGELTA